MIFLIVRDEREEMINKLCLYMQPRTNESMMDIKNELYLLLNDFEIIGRSTEIAEVKEDRNEFLLKKFLVAKKLKDAHEGLLNFMRHPSRRSWKRLEKPLMISKLMISGIIWRSGCGGTKCRR